MKKILIYVVVLATSFTIMAQNEHIHVFRKDTLKLNSFKASEIKSILHIGETSENEFSKIEILNADNETFEIKLNVIDSIQTRLTDLPVFYINLQDYPNWTELQGKKDDEHPATLRMEGNGMFEDLEEQTVEFRGRGNSTWNMRKKPYRFKMGKKASVCGLPKSKTFVLLANYIDCSLMRNAIGLWTANYLEMPYSNHFVPVRVIFNGIDKGAYLLTEKIGIGSGSVDIDEDTGILFELDANYDEDYKFKFSLNDITLPVMIKDPDITEITLPEGYTIEQYFQTWEADFSEMAKAILTSEPNADLSKYIDLESAVNFFIVQSLALNFEVRHPKSFYLYKKSFQQDEVYHFGPVWDLDWAYTYNGKKENMSPYGNLAGGNGKYQGGSFIQALFKNTAFRSLYKEKWDKFVSDGYPMLKEFMQSYAHLIEPQAINNGKLWPDSGDNDTIKMKSSLEFRNNFEALKDWIEKRINYCTNHQNFGIY